jgi:hypothetical protein
MSWLTRRAIAAATATLHVRHYKDDNNVEHIDIEQKIASGLPGTTENRTLDWTFRESSDFIFGPVLGKSRRVPVDEIDNEFLRNGWMPDTVEHGVIDAYVKSDTPKSKMTWMVEQVRQHFRYILASLVYKTSYPFRSGDSKKSMVKDAMSDTLTSSARKMSIFRPVWSSTSVSLFYLSICMTGRLTALFRGASV